MFDKAPNHRFSRLRNREVSTTEALFDRVLRSLPKKKTRKEDLKVRGPLLDHSIGLIFELVFQALAATMAQSVPNQARINGSIGTESRDAPNGTGNNGSNAVVIDATNFGVFHDQIQGEVAKLEEGCDRVNEAVEMLSKTFAKYGKIVNTVGQRWGKDQALEDEIRDLQATKRELIKLNSLDRNDHEKELSKMEKEYKKELSSLQEQAKAGEKESKKYENLTKSLQKEHTEAQQKLDKDFLKRVAQLESDNAEKMAKLEAENVQLKSDKAQLEKDLATRTAQLDEERDTRETMQAKARAEFKALEKELTGIKARYRLESHPLKF